MLGLPTASSYRIGSPTARISSRSLESAVEPTAARVTTNLGTKPTTVGVLANRLLATDLGVAHLVAVGALDTGEVTRLGALSRHVAELVAVAAGHGGGVAGLVALLGYVVYGAAIAARTGAAAGGAVLGEVAHWEDVLEG